MELQFIELGKLSVSKANMRYAKKAPDVSDILPTVRKRGIIVPVLVRPNCAPDAYEIVAGARRFHAASIVADERRAEGQEDRKSGVQGKSVATRVDLGCRRNLKKKNIRFT